MRWKSLVLVVVLTACGDGEEGCNGADDLEMAEFTVEIDGSGTVRVQTGSVDERISASDTVHTDQELTLTAEPGEGWAFAAWEGSPLCTSDEPVVVVPPQQSFTTATCTARFVQVEDLVVIVTGEGTGLVELTEVADPARAIDPCATADGTCAYDGGDATELRLVARPDPGSVLGLFAADGVECEAPDTCTVDVSSGKYTFTARFDKVEDAGEREDCVLDEAFDSVLDELTPAPGPIALCDDAAAGAQEPSLVDSEFALPASTGIAVKYAATYALDLALTGREDTFGCSAPGVWCGYGGDSALGDGPHLVVAIQLSAPFETGPAEYAAVDVAVRGTGTEIDPPMFAGTEGATEIATIEVSEGYPYVSHLLGSETYGIDFPSRSPRALVDGDTILVLLPREPGFDAAAADTRVLSTHILDEAWTWDAWSAPALPGWSPVVLP